jgi:cyclic pyranopterin phosphate synthase
VPLLDVILGYDCNLACDYCTITPAMRQRSLGAAHVLAEMRRARADGYDAIQLTGGEPTIRADLRGLVRAAKQLGFSSIKIQSNGLMWGVGHNVQRMVDAGANTFSVSIHAHEEEDYERLVRRDGTFHLMRRGVEALVSRELDPSVDLIIKADSMARLADAVDWIADRGVRRVDLWYVSLTDANAEHPESLPAMSAAMPHVRAALARARARQMTARSLHIPRCLLGDDAAHAWDPARQGVRVLTPDAVFDLALSKLTPQRFVPACEGCPERSVCSGLRADYLEHFGDGEIASVRGQTASRAGRVSLPLLDG